MDALKKNNKKKTLQSSFKSLAATVHQYLMTVCVKKAKQAKEKMHHQFSPFNNVKQNLLTLETTLKCCNTKRRSDKLRCRISVHK